MNLYELHERLTKHLFPAYASEDERFLALALGGEAGELAEKILESGPEDAAFLALMMCARAGKLSNYVKKRWRDRAEFTEEIRDEIADIRMYLELLAKCFDIEGEKLDQRVEDKLMRVVERFRDRLQPHRYVPSTLHMGDCRICGHLQNADIHEVV
jgi:NTP pyrophosphatase (non-canonical NTP hydrolase)